MSRGGGCGGLAGRWVGESALRCVRCAGDREGPTSGALLGAGATRTGVQSAESVCACVRAEGVRRTAVRGMR